MNSNDNSYVLIISAANNIDYWTVKLAAASDICFDIKVKDYDETIKEICRVVPNLANLDADIMEAYDDAFRTKPSNRDLIRVKKFVENNDFINVSCSPFSYLGFDSNYFNE